MRICVLVLLLTAATKVAHTTPTWPYLSFKWSINAANCRPDAGTLHARNYTTGAGYIATSSTTDVVLYCPLHTLVTNESEQFWTVDSKYLCLKITYLGLHNGSSAYTQAVLYSMSKSTGVESLMFSATAAGSSSVSTTETFQGSFNWDEVNNYYYFRVTLHPATGGYGQTFYGLQFRVGTVVNGSCT